MVRTAERKALARARGFLSYHAAGKWTALVAGVGTALLYVVLLGLLWLYADLIVYHGQIPHFRDLPEDRRHEVVQQWHEDPDPEVAQFLKEIGETPERIDHLTHADLEQLLFREREFLWRLHLYQLLRHRVSGAAAALVLPAYNDLPEHERQAFTSPQGWWNQLNEKDRKQFLVDLQFSPDEIDRLTGNTVLAEPPEQRDADLDMMWRAYVAFQFRHFVGESGWASGEVRDALENQVRAEAAKPTRNLQEDQLGNRGVLSLVVRANFQSRYVSVVAGWLASPWMWQGYMQYLLVLLIVSAVLVLLRAVLAFVQIEAAARATITASTRLRRAIYHHTFRLGTLAIRELGPSEAVSILTRHTEAVHDGLYTWLTVYFREPVKFVLLLVFALLIHPLLAVIFLLSAGLVWLVGGQVASYFRRRGQEATNRASEQLTLIRESLMLMRLVKVYLMELFNQARVERLLARYAKLQLRRYRGEAIYLPSLSFMGTLAVLGFLYVAGLIVLSDHLGVAAAITLAVALVSLYWPLLAILQHRRFLRRAREASVVLFKFLDRPGEVGQMVGAEFLPSLSKHLEFDNVSLREPGTSRMLLQDISLAIPSGQRVGLVGAEDREKHALIYLIPRFLDPTAGEIRIDDHNLRYITLDSLRVQIALVMQHDLVFHDTVANNISCGDPAYTLPQIIEAAKVAHAHHFIQKLPQGYETPIGELGHSLTVSEQFRVGLARAILRDPALLIIEEPSTQLDEDTKSLLDDTFTRVLPGRTVIFLPHRISTIRSCDQLFLLHRGKLEATGVHRELLGQNALYRHLHYLEFNEIDEQV